MLVNLRCQGCGVEQKRMVRSIQDRPPCSTCGGATERAPLPPSVKVEETVDNGIMARRVTRLANADELFRNRRPKTPVH